jgi:hypothetical protein
LRAHLYVACATVRLASGQQKTSPSGEVNNAFCFALRATQGK